MQTARLFGSIPRKAGGAMREVSARAHRGAWVIGTDALRDCVRRAKFRKLARNLVPSDAAYRDQTVWLGWKDSNSEMSWQIISLKDRTDLRASSRNSGFGDYPRLSCGVGD